MMQNRNYDKQKMRQNDFGNKTRLVDGASSVNERD
jgi:hypothetical protein